MTPSESRRQTLSVMVAWLQVRQANTRTLIEALGTPDEETLTQFYAMPEEEFENFLSLITETVVKELQFLSENGFSGVKHVDLDETRPEGEPLQ